MHALQSKEETVSTCRAATRFVLVRERKLFSNQSQLKQPKLRCYYLYTFTQFRFNVFFLLTSAHQNKVKGYAYM